MATTSHAAAPVLAAVPGQEGAASQLASAVRAPLHAYLLVGPPGVGGMELAKAYGAALLCDEGGCGACQACRRAVEGSHPDVVVVQREGASISMDAAREAIRTVWRSPMEGARKVVVLDELHLLAEDVAPVLLKTIEEPPPSTVIVGIAEEVTDDLVTVASRCAVVPLAPLTADLITRVLVAEGVDQTSASAATALAGGRLDRARVLATDPEAAARAQAWRSVPDRLDGTGSAVAREVDALLGAIDQALEPLRAVHAAEREAAEADAKSSGERAGPRLKRIDERHKREERRFRTDELRGGLSLLASVLRDRVASAAPADRAGWVSPLEAIAGIGDAFDRNANEALLLQALFLRLDAAIA